MAPVTKAEKKAAFDAAAWMFNVVTSVGIIMVNKALMATHGFSFGEYPCFKAMQYVLQMRIAFTFNVSSSLQHVLKQNHY